VADEHDELAMGIAETQVLAFSMVDNSLPRLDAQKEQ
jgi:hypothetical protein